VLGSALRGPGVTVADAVRAVEFVLPSLEIVDSRIQDWKISLFDTIADNASSGGVVLGSSGQGRVHSMRTQTNPAPHIIVAGEHPEQRGVPV